MCKIDFMFSYLSRIPVLIFFFLCAGTFSQTIKPVIGVVGLENQGGLTRTEVDSICNRITEIAAQIEKHELLERKYIVPTLEEQGFEVYSEFSSQKDALIAAGHLISANEIIGGTIKREKKVLTLELKHIDVMNSTVLTAEKFVFSDTRHVFFADELPSLVYEVFDIQPVEETTENKEAVIAGKKKSKTPFWVLVGSLVAIGTAGGVYAIIDGNEPDGPEVPLSDLPIRTR